MIGLLIKMLQVSTGGMFYLDFGLFIRRPLQLRAFKEQGRDLTQSYDKAFLPTENSKEQSDNTKTPPERWLHNNCGPTSDEQLE